MRLRQGSYMRSQAELRLPPESIAPTLARAAIAAMASGLPAEAASDVELLTSEVVSNAVKHSKLSPSDEIIVRFVMDGYVRVEVMDPGPPFDAQPTRPDLAGWDPDSIGWDCWSSTLSRRLGGSNPRAVARRSGSKSVPADHHLTRVRV